MNGENKMLTIACVFIAVMLTLMLIRDFYDGSSALP